MIRSGGEKRVIRKTYSRSYKPLFLLGIILASSSVVAGPIAQSSRRIEIRGPEKSLIIRAEIASTPKARSQGLMNRKSLAPHHGMLFIFPKSEPHSFWMKNTLIPLDMLFVNDNLKIIHIVANAKPMTTTSRGTKQPSRFVLELPGGYCARHEIKVGHQLIIPPPFTAH